MFIVSRALSDCVRGRTRIVRSAEHCSSPLVGSLSAVISMWAKWSERVYVQIYFFCFAAVDNKLTRTCCRATADRKEGEEAKSFSACQVLADWIQHKLRAYWSWHEMHRQIEARNDNEVVLIVDYKNKILPKASFLSAGDWFALAGWSLFGAAVYCGSRAEQKSMQKLLASAAH